MRLPGRGGARSNVLAGVLAYLAWLVSSAACVVALLQLQSAANLLGAALGANRFALRLGNQVILWVGGLAAFVYVMFLEAYYRHGASRGILRQRFVKTIAVPLGLILLLLALVEITLRTRA